MGRTIDIQYNDLAAIEKAREKKLSVLLESDSFFYWLTDENNKVISIEQVDGTDLEVLHQIAPNQINFAFVHDTGYIIPDSLHEKELLASMMHTTNDVKNWESYSLKNPQALLYLPKNGKPALSADLQGKVKSYVPLAKYFLFPSFIPEAQFEEAIVHLHFMEKLVYLAVYRGNKLLLWQTVTLESAYELQYFCLLTYQQFKMDREEVPLLLSGRIAAGSQMYHLIYPYFSNIQWATFPDKEEGPIIPDAIPAHYLSDLWLIHQCA